MERRSGGGFSTRKAPSTVPNKAHNAPGWEASPRPTKSQRKLICFRCYKPNEIASRCTTNFDDPGQVQATLLRFEALDCDVQAGMPNLVYLNLKSWLTDDMVDTKCTFFNPFARGDRRSVTLADPTPPSSAPSGTADSSSKN